MTQQSVQYNFVIPNPVNRILRLPSFAPDPCPIVGTLMFCQNPETGFPSWAYGDISVAVDPRSAYCNASGFPTNQFEEPLFLKTIAIMETIPGRPRGVHKRFRRPIMYSAGNGDCLVFAPEMHNISNMLLYLGVIWLQDGDIPDQAGTGIFSTTFDASVSANANISLRSIISPSPQIASSVVRIRVSSGADYMTLQNFSIGVRDGTSPNMVAAPVPVTFGSMPDLTLAPYSRRWSDWVSLTRGATDQLLVNLDLFNGSNAWAYRTSGVGGSYASAVASFDAAVMRGSPAFVAGRGHIVDQAEVR